MKKFRTSELARELGVSTNGPERFEQLEDLYETRCSKNWRTAPPSQGEGHCSSGAGKV